MSARLHLRTVTEQSSLLSCSLGTEKEEQAHYKTLGVNIHDHKLSKTCFLYILLEYNITQNYQIPDHVCYWPVLAVLTGYVTKSTTSA